MRKVDKEKLSECLFGPWSYEDEKYSMRWDPIEDRRYALMWDDPAARRQGLGRSGWRTCLRIGDYRCSPVLSSKKGLGTTGFSKINGRDYFTWPIWNRPLSPDAVRSVLSLKELRDERPDRRKLSDMGIKRIFRSERIKVGSGGQYKVNFATAGPVP